MAFMNCMDVFLQMCMRKRFTKRFTFVIFMALMNFMDVIFKCPSWENDLPQDSHSHLGLRFVQKKVMTYNFSQIFGTFPYHFWGTCRQFRIWTLNWKAYNVGFFPCNTLCSKMAQMVQKLIFYLAFFCLWSVHFPCIKCWD